VMLGQIMTTSLTVLSTAPMRVPAFVVIPLTQSRWQKKMTSNLEVGEDRLTSDCIRAKVWVQKLFAPAFEQVAKWEPAEYKETNHNNVKENNDRANRRLRQNR
jgi:hypothetical protein